MKHGSTMYVVYKMYLEKLFVNMDGVQTYTLTQEITREFLSTIIPDSFHSHFPKTSPFPAHWLIEQDTSITKKILHKSTWSWANEFIINLVMYSKDTLTLQRIL